MLHPTTDKLNVAWIVAFAALSWPGEIVHYRIELPGLPFYPEQTIAHYLSHLLYGLAQLPLIIIMIVEIRRAPHIR